MKQQFWPQNAHIHLRPDPSKYSDSQQKHHPILCPPTKTAVLQSLIQAEQQSFAQRSEIGRRSGFLAVVGFVKVWLPQWLQQAAMQGSK
ncbi:MAG TPA: hypothetical protein PKH92_07530 [Anaerolineaceae bacterium]|nr:hypothetical protein [Anaerolineaceae bacterium]HOD04881.1 hypothetical protein [Anaerolineaceae bacterium]